MSSMRVARTLNPRAISSRTARCSFATTHPAPTSSQAQSMIPVSNIEAQWETLNNKEQLEVYQQLLDAQKRDWKTLSIDEKKAGGAEVRTMSKEWQEATNEKALEEKWNPLTGVASEGYKGKGHVASK
ncbi:Cytochrome c oxidase subunit 5A [Tulasnella sp. 403]|nr:Cytochrome c oxidase subunit 5A [Tulasnella sp. 403]